MTIDIDRMEALARRGAAAAPDAALALIARLREAEAREQALAAHVEAAQRIADEDRVDHPMHTMKDGEPYEFTSPGWRSKMGRDLHHALKGAPATSLARHPDDAAVDRFAAAMKAKLADARAKGRDGWDDPSKCTAEFLADQLVGHVSKGNAGNLEDIANLAMMLHQRSDDPKVVAQVVARRDAKMKAEALDSAVRTAKVKRQVAVAQWLKDLADNYRRQAEAAKVGEE
ncbi:hypothetical protein HPA02_32230 [Bisbaumannia pacifica]|uniref:Uncharacterized protein n=1 Tax=Bisbaumannia pacifica TaxID=77098 RepID=A0A510XGS6_9GAMM|nr:hypothetical protein [Halomonas pacifica]GEK48940.1 hypothetical protein HPA02_32230 [Halomonas pacifica]